MKKGDFGRMENLEKYKKMMQTSRKVVIIPHHNPDADALGASLAIYLYLSKKGHDIQIISPSAYPNFLDWMPSQDDILVYCKEQETKCFQKIVEAEVIFYIDFSDYKRMTTLSVKAQENKDAFVVVIDHHQDPNIRTDFQLWNNKASSTCELVYDFIEMLGDKKLIDIPIAECLYAGIVTDTSSFKHPSTTKRVHIIAAEVMDLGVDTNKVQRLIYDNNSVGRLRLLGYAFSEKLRVLPEYKTAYFTLNQQELKRFDYKTGDTEGVVNYALSIKGVRFAIIMVEKPDGVKMSFRSVGSFQVNSFAREHFSGGGHKNAAGGISYLSLEETVTNLLALLPQYKEELENL